MCAESATCGYPGCLCSIPSCPCHRQHETAERPRVFVVVVCDEQTWDMPMVEAFNTKAEALAEADRLGWSNLSLHVCYLDGGRRLADVR